MREINPNHSKYPFLETLRFLLSEGIPVSFKAKGISMWPFIKNDDVVVVYPFESTSPQFGQVVAFIHPVTDRLTIHRIIGKRKGYLKVKADNASESDGLIPSANIIGCVKKVLRRKKEIYWGLGLERFVIARINRIVGFPLLFRSLIGKFILPMISRVHGEMGRSFKCNF